MSHTVFLTRAPRRTLRACVLSLGLLMAAAPLHADEGEDLRRMGTFVELMGSYYELMGTIHSVAADPDKTAVLQMTKLKEFLERSGQRDRVPEVLKRIAETTTRPAVRNAATMMLAEAQAERGDNSAAAATLERALLGRQAP